MLKGQVFKEQIFESQIFAFFVDTFLNGKCGIGQYGNNMELSYSGSNITIQNGVCCIKGRFLEEDSNTTIDAGTNTAYCRLVIEIDLNKENTEESFLQGAYKILTSLSAYPELTQTDIVQNNSGIYQYELASFTTSLNGITNFQDKRTFLDFDSIYEEIQKHIADIDSQNLGVHYVTGEEIRTKDTLDGKPIYCKRFEWIGLFTKARKGIPLGIPLSDIKIFKVEGHAYSDAGNVFILSTGDMDDYSGTTIKLAIDKKSNTIYVETYNEYFTPGSAYANFYYTKNSDNKIIGD